ncbi:MAG: von Willebrand factor type A domain-containing protein, partial [Ignavibacteria bacterium]|nr:von Willebrand factor type A domain-containing protein [Ignavibacteria bacterium]
MKLIQLNRFGIIVLALIIVACTKDDNINNIGGYEPMPEVYNEKYKDYEENPFVKANEQPVSTFSVDADGASYANMRRFLYLSQIPPKASVRIEEYINYFTFDYAEPTDGENVSLQSELASCPWNTDHYIMRIGMKGKTIPESELPNSNYVFLIDVSGSMNSPEKLGILKTGFIAMVDHLRDQDRVAIVTYAGQAAVLLPSTYGDEKDKIKAAINQLGAGGSTAGAAGILTAYEIAEANFIVNGNNRVILGSDGDFNVGPSSNEDLIKLIEEKRETGIYLTVLGVGSGNLNDYMMEQIANKGNGNYEYIDNAKQIQKVFVDERAKFYTIAKDSKIQITFNANKVDAYRLIGYENRSLNENDFENDSTDAGEIGSSQTITALYELVLMDVMNAEKYAQFDFRYKKPNETESRLLSHEINSSPVAIENSTE